VPTPSPPEAPSTEIALPATAPFDVFSSAAHFELAQRIAKSLAASTLVPTQYQQNLPNCLVAMEMANRMDASILMVMQNLYVIQGRPCWSSPFIIASINSCGRFSPLQFDLTGEPGSIERRCIAHARDLKTGLRLESPEISITMAKLEGWLDRPGSKWKTMPDLMLRYRAGAFFGRLFCPEKLLGMHSVEEVGDIIDVTPRPPASAVTAAKQMLTDAVDAQQKTQEAP
jgi:hypothetical protein